MSKQVSLKNNIHSKAFFSDAKDSPAEPVPYKTHKTYVPKGIDMALY